MAEKFPLCKGDMILMDLGQKDFHIREGFLQFLCQIGADRVFRLEMAGIYKGDAVFCRIGELIVLAVCGD